MGNKTAWTLLLLAATLVVPAGALANANASYVTGGYGALPGATVGGTAIPVGAFAGAFPGCSIGVINALNDVHYEATQEMTHHQAVGVTDDNVLLAIALRNNGAGDIGFKQIRNAEITDTRRVTASQNARLERNDVFSALALGLHDGGGALEALACVSNFATAATETTRQAQQVRLDEDTVLLAIALHNSGGSPISYDDVVNLDVSSRTTQVRDQQIDVPRDNTFNALVLGAGDAGY